MALHTEPRTQQSYKQEMAAHARWMGKAKLDREEFIKEMSELESDALDAEEAVDEDPSDVESQGPTGAYDSDAEAEERSALAVERE